MSRRIGVVTVARSDYGIYFPVLRLLQGDPDIDLSLIVGAAHLSAEFGNTIQEIERDGFPVAARVPIAMRGDSRQDVAQAIGEGVQGFAAAYDFIQPDILVVLGDRYEMFAAAIAALPLSIPVAHIHGGEITLGAIDDAIRHCITKLSHIHFAATEEYARRIRQLGEEPWRVHVTGSPAIDSIVNVNPTPRQELEDEFGLDLSHTLLITYHPETLAASQDSQIAALLGALSRFEFQFLFTYPNADSESDQILQRVKEFVRSTRRARLVSNLGHRKYHSIQRYVAAMVGNSSSGIIEAASFGLPVVNIGARQMGRTRTANVIDVDAFEENIAGGISRAVSPEFRTSVASLRNPYGDGNASPKIVSVLKSVSLGGNLLLKKFIDHACC